MSLDIEQVKTIRSQALAQLEQITLEPKPSYAIDGQRVEWAQYAESLQRTVSWCDDLLQDHKPFEIVSQATTS